MKDLSKSKATKYSLLVSDEENVRSRFDKNGKHIDSPDDENNIEPKYLFSFDDGKILQEFNFLTDETTIYRNAGDGSLAVLYEMRPYNTTNFEGGSFYIYTPSIMYSAFKENNGSILKISSADAMVVKKQSDMKAKFSKNSMVHKLQEAQLNNYVSKNLNVILSEYGEITNVSEYEKFMELYRKYSVSSEYIAASCVIENLSKIINNYIVTRNLNNHDLLVEYIKLAHFGGICNKSISGISDFIEDPSHCDLRALCDSLNSSAKNLKDFAKNKLNNILKDTELEK